jgi:hypothetical protein
MIAKASVRGGDSPLQLLTLIGDPKYITFGRWH